MSQQPATLFPAPPAAIEPDWLRDIRRRDTNLTTTQARTAPHDRRALLKGYDEQACRLTELESQLANAERAGKEVSGQYLEALTRAEAAEARATGLQTELAEQQREKLALVQENQLLRERLGPQPNQAEIDEVLGQLQERLTSQRAAAPTLVGDETPAPPDSQLPFDPGFTLKCHGCGLDSHVKRCKTVGCPAKNAPAASLVEEKGPAA